MLSPTSDVNFEMIKIPMIMKFKTIAWVIIDFDSEVEAVLGMNWTNPDPERKERACVKLSLCCMG